MYKQILPQSVHDKLCPGRFLAMTTCEICINLQKYADPLIAGPLKTMKNNLNDNFIWINRQLYIFISAGLSPVDEFLNKKVFFY
jgi:hypothetical protein